MTFMSCFTQLNIMNNNWFNNCCNPLTSFVPNMWNNVSLFNCYNNFSFLNFNFPVFNLWNINSFNNNFNWNNTPTWNNTPVWNNTSNLNDYSNWSNNTLNCNNSSSWNTVSFGDTFIRTTNNNNTIKQNSSTLKLEGYNASAGKKLANIAMQRRQTDSWQSVKGTGKCASYTKKAIEAAGMGAYESGHGYQMASILSKNKNFKQISADGIDVTKLPAGCVLVYGKGVAGYNPEYGHTEITTGDGRAVSQAITNNVKQHPSAIFIPV